MSIDTLVYIGVHDFTYVVHNNVRVGENLCVDTWIIINLTSYILSNPRIVDGSNNP